MSHESVRTCLGCRQRATRQELLRVVAQDSGAGLAVVPDPERRLPGRGAHLHPTPECLALARRRQAFSRALRVSGLLASDRVEGYVDQLSRQNIEDNRPTRNWSISS